MGAGIMFLNEEGEALVLRRNEYKQDKWGGYWDFPGGGAEEGESSYETALRESYEEAGHPSSFKIVDHFRNGNHYTLYLALVPKKFKPRLSEEHITWAWLKPIDIINLPLHPKDKKPLVKYLYRSGKDFASPPKSYSPPKG